jgi:hypothetical protein
MASFNEIYAMGACVFVVRDLGCHIHMGVTVSRRSYLGAV